jgi:hypothetical protein
MSERDPQPCVRFEEALPALLGIDGERLPAEEEAALIAHAAGCPACSELRRSYAATVDLLRALPRKEAPADFLSWVGKEGRAAPVRPGRHLWLAAAAILVAGATTFLVIDRLSRPAGIEVAGRPAPPPEEPALTTGAPASRQPPDPLPREVPAVGSPESAYKVASPVGDGEAIGIVLDVEIPVAPDRWTEEILRVENDLRARFETPRAVAARSAADAVALRSRGSVPEGERQETREQAVPPPAPRDIRLEVEGSSLPLLVERIEGWAKEAGGSVRVEGGARLLEKLGADAAAAAATAARVPVQVRLRPAAAPKSP